MNSIERKLLTPVFTLSLKLLTQEDLAVNEDEHKMQIFFKRYIFYNTRTLFRFCSTYQYTFKKCPSNILKNSGLFSIPVHLWKVFRYYNKIEFADNITNRYIFLKSVSVKLTYWKKKPYRNSVSGGPLFELFEFKL
jgi:hypothetical protein